LQYLTGDGLHIKSDIASDKKAFLIIEGDSYWTQGGHSACAIVMADNGGDPDKKGIAIDLDSSFNQPVLSFERLGDDMLSDLRLIQLWFSDARVEINGAINSGTLTHSAVGPTDNLDVTAVNTIFVNTASNHVTIGGFVGGVEGQTLKVVVINATNNTVLEHAEGTGNQDIYLWQGSDETLTAVYGGWTLVCNGTHWYDVDWEPV